MIHMPKGFGKIAASKEHAWYYEARPGAQGAQSTQTWITDSYKFHLILRISGASAVERRGFGPALDGESR